MPASSVLIVSYRPGTWLADSIRSVAGQADQVVVVDNGSDGAAASAVARHEGAECVRSPRNVGFAGGTAVGLPLVRGDVVGVLNDDAVAGEQWLAAARSVLADTGVAAVTPKVVLAGWFAEVVLPDDEWFAPGDPRPLGRMLRSVTVEGREVLGRLVGAGVHELERDDPAGEGGGWRWTSGRRPIYVPLPDGSRDGSPDGAPDGAPEASICFDGEPVAAGTRCRVLNHAGSYLEAHGVAGEFGFGAPDDGRFDAPAERFGFSGTAPVFRAETLARLGGFAEAFFAYNEDTDWCLRARLAGLQVRYEPASVVTHRLSATSGGSAAARVRFLQQRNALLCLVRNAPREVAARHLASLAVHGSGPGVRRSVARLLPWAIAERARLRRGWATRPRQVWDRWAGADRTWDDGPARRRGEGVGADVMGQ